MFPCIPLYNYYNTDYPLGTSVPVNLSECYREHRGSTPPSNISRKGSKDTEEGEGVMDEDDDDDYEPMNPGVLAMANWEEARRELFDSEYNRPGLHMPGTARRGPDSTSPIRYSSVVLPSSGGDAKPQLKATANKRLSTPLNGPFNYVKPGTCCSN